jgi:predicted P-loop ATPase
VQRIDRWLVAYGGAEDTEYVRAVGALVLVAAVRRVRQPGCKFDEMIVLESEQGRNKSKALEILAVEPEWFTDNLPLGLPAKETIEALSGHWIVEVSELQGMRKSDIDKVKAFLSRNTDRARMAYDRTVTEARRQCVIIGTTNSEQYLRDLTGNRRFWPVRIERFGLEALERDRDQLWAEAAAREASRDSIRLPESLWVAAAAEQQQRVVENPFISVLERVLHEPDQLVDGESIEGKWMEGAIATEDLWTIVGVRPAQRTQDNNEKLGDAMKQLGWNRDRLRVGAGKRSYVYTRGPKPHRWIVVELMSMQEGAPAQPVASYATIKPSY